MADSNWLQDIVTKALSGGRKSVSPTQTAGQGGATAYGGYLVDRERSPALKGTQRYVTYSDLLANTSIVASGTRYFLNILGKSKWSVEPAKDAEGNVMPGAQEAADLVEATMGDMSTPWAKVIRRASMYRFFGFSIQEWTAKRRDDGKIGMLDVEARPQVTINRWDLDEGGTVLGAWQLTELGAQELYLPRKKIIHLVDDTLNDSPEGLGLFRHVVKAAARLKAYEDLEAVAFETDLRGIPIARAPLAAIRKGQKAGTINAAEANKLLAPINAFLNGHIRSRKSGLMIDSEVYRADDDGNRPSSVPMWSAELLQGSSTSQEAVANAIMRITHEMSIVLGCEHLLLGQDGTGSLALSKSKLESFFMTVQAALQDIIEAYNRDYIRPLCELNGIPKELWPKFKTDDVQFKDVETMAAALRDMATAGAILPPDDPAIGEMRDLLGLSRTPTDMLEREMENNALKTGAELDAMNAKAEALRAPKPTAGGGKDKGGADVKAGERT